MGSLEQQDSALYLKQFFNEQQSVTVFQVAHKSNPHFNKIHFQNVGIKIMLEAFKIFSQRQIEHVQIVYDWNHIMMRPDLVCYDKNKWSSLQQLANWNKQWNQLFLNTPSLKSISACLSISWMDEQFMKSFLEGLTKLANLKRITIEAKSKDENVEKMLKAFEQARIFPSFEFKFRKI